MANEFTTYSAKGNREDLSDFIYDISPTDTPMLAMIGTNKATGTTHEWQVDALDAAAENAKVEGADATIQATTATKRLKNHTQIFTKTGAISKTQDVVNKAGRAKELAYQLEKRTKEIKRDMELAIVGNQKPDDGSVSEARKLRPFCGWITKNYSGGSGFAPGTETAAATAGTPIDLAESLVTDVIQKCYEAGGNPTKIMLAPSKKTAFSKLTGIGTNVRINREPTSTTAGQTVDVYQSDFGLLDVIPNRIMKSATASLNNEDKILIIDPEYWAFSTLRPIKTEMLSKTGDSDKFMLVTEGTLEAKNPDASGAVFDLK